MRQSESVGVRLAGVGATEGATPRPAMVILANLPWLLVPAAAIARMARNEHPFTGAAAAGL